MNNIVCTTLSHDLGSLFHICKTFLKFQKKWQEKIEGDFWAHQSYRRWSTCHIGAKMNSGFLTRVLRSCQLNQGSKTRFKLGSNSQTSKGLPLRSSALCGLKRQSTSTKTFSPISYRPCFPNQVRSYCTKVRFCNHDVNYKSLNSTSVFYSKSWQNSWPHIFSTCTTR